ncbi:TAXI family TRAP transporter solute-binding subunit [Natronolimnohabitans innermongolicus]|uniref:TRAP-type transport system periplasmic protein 2 n=1 Tax=Natronolimnohabitans innermongolicus JCM 12255 TaxID=1227499 RepID=L9WML6_9EURY|nr:TAXI family TRAP transporter solute-binding subunit [Natronolimnohabitans innermongolicus]ELY50461.1 TRAP-type transport system periplasmic protein 2 [Natronolimnohabitans innermongolicus JCM 12255]
MGGDGGDQLQMRTSTEDTSAYQLSAGLAAVADDHDELSIDARPSDGALQSMRQLDAGDADLAYTDSYNSWEIVNEMGEYEENPFENEIQSAFWYYDIYGGLVSADQETAETVEDLEGLSVNPNPVGTAMRTMTEAHLEHAIDLDSYDELALDYGEEGSALGEGTADVVSDIRINVDLQPSYVEEQYSINDDAWLVHWPDDVVESIQDDEAPVTGAYLDAEDTPGPEFGDRDEEWWVATVYNVYVREDFDNDTMYSLLEMIRDNSEELADYQDLAGDWADMENLAEPAADIPDVEMHEGARDFFEDEGVL